MPVKVRCRGCEKVLNAPDKARGKVIKCPQCGTKLKVPTGKKKVEAPASSADSAEFLAGMNLDSLGLEDRNQKVCPYCAAEMDEEDVVCPDCGMNTQTGRMDAKIAKRKARRGPDPNEFYRKAWGDSWRFVFDQKGLAIRTGMYWTIYSVLNALSVFFLVKYVAQIPLLVFWGGMSLITMLGVPGWWLFLALKIVDKSVHREKIQADRIHFDFFQSVALGLRMIIWPVVATFPFVFLAPLAMGLLLPVALVHMTAKYTYRAWIFWEIGRVFLKNIGPSLYVVILGAVVNLPVILIGGAVGYFVGGNAFQSVPVNDLTARIVTWALELAGENPNPETFVFWIIQSTLTFLAAIIVTAPVMFIAAFPAVFIMRVIGLMGMYFARDLDLVNKIHPNTPATLGVRMLAFGVDILLSPLASFIVTSEKKAVIVGQLINAAFVLNMYYLGREQAVMIFGPIWLTYSWWMYFAVQESSNMRTTVGKDGFGVIVQCDDGKKMTLLQGTKRFFASLVTVATGFVGFLLVGVSPDKKALHDRLSKTVVVWRGDK
ncbi:MAG: RDD family protein [Maioricimonas sp. JB045]|uniref:RDD family protein n=1 Tax=Maioricimonas sp. JC845 TaxID=3232138 RepID=UPI003458492B